LGDVLPFFPLRFKEHERVTREINERGGRVESAPAGTYPHCYHFINCHMPLEQDYLNLFSIDLQRIKIISKTVSKNVNFA
jgi:hypothetical protein